MGVGRGPGDGRPAVGLATRRVDVPASGVRTRRFRLTRRGARWARTAHRRFERVAVKVRPVPGPAPVQTDLVRLTVRPYGSVARTKRGR